MVLQLGNQHNKALLNQNQIFIISDSAQEKLISL